MSSPEAIRTQILALVKEYLTNTNLIMNNTFFIGLYPGITDIHLDYISEVFARFMKGERV
jgi:dTDP-4-amino-4,6-dideoxygalactose transaminase